jgi:hypothetical protein
MNDCIIDKKMNRQIGIWKFDLSLVNIFLIENSSKILLNFWLFPETFEKFYYQQLFSFVPNNQFLVHLLKNLINSDFLFDL